MPGASAGPASLFERSCCLQVKRDLLEGHQEELRHTEQKIELLKRDLGDREAAWQVTCEELGRAAEERLSRRLLELREQAESEKRSLTNRFELREAEMRQLQDRQAAQILDLEGSLVEQQGRLRQLELGLAGDESLRCSQCGRELGSPGPADQDRELATLHLQEPSALQPKPAQSRWVTSFCPGWVQSPRGGVLVLPVLTSFVFFARFPLSVAELSFVSLGEMEFIH